jgi:hypothetical protein
LISKFLDLAKVKKVKITVTEDKHSDLFDGASVNWKRPTTFAPSVYAVKLSFFVTKAGIK